MDAHHFDRLARLLATIGTRRSLLSLTAALPLAGVLAARLTVVDTEAKRNKKKKRKKKKKKRTIAPEPCVPDSAAQTCAGKCATVTNNCQEAVDCGPCACEPPCPVCQGCNASTGQCAADAARDGQGCGGIGEVCAQGRCVKTCVAPTDDLQAAIDAAAVDATVTLCAGTWKLGATVAIAKDLTLHGAGADQTILDGGDAVRVLQIAASAAVRLEDLTIANGNATGTPPASTGGGILNQGDLNLRGVAIRNNAAEFGGGIANVGTLTLQTGCRVARNSALLEGAGIHSGGFVTMQAGSKVSNNIAAGSGGGIYSGGTTTLEAGSEVSGNAAGDAGGGIFSSGFTVVLESGSQVTGNRADEGGGIFNAALSEVIVRGGSRVSGNSADDGGGIFNFNAFDDSVIVEEGALVCDNEPAAAQCTGTISGDCPTGDGTCDA